MARAIQKFIGDNTAIDTVDGINYHIVQIDSKGRLDEVLIGEKALENLYYEIGQELLRKKVFYK